MTHFLHGPYAAGRRGNAAGIALTLVLVLGLIGLGIWLLQSKDAHQRDLAEAEVRAAAVATQAQETTPIGERPAPPEGAKPSPIEPLTAPPWLELAATYAAKDGILDVDISEYAGYAGLVVANGGLAPNPASFFSKNYGFQVRLSLSEEDTWGKLNNGQLAAGATTVDCLAALGRQFEVTVPALIGFSRGSDMVIVDADIAAVNQLAGKVLAASQFNESEFFIRYLAQEAGIPVQVLRNPGDEPQDGHLGLVFYEDAFTACDAYLHELASARPGLDGAVGWTPRTSEVVEASQGLAKVLVSNRNLLVVADILCLNKGWAQAQPKQAEGLVHGLLEGNRLLRENQAAHLGLVAKSFGWTEAEARDLLAMVHLANQPEARAFFDGSIDAAGSFSSIYYASTLAYGSIVPNPVGPERFLDPAPLAALAGKYADQKIAIAPIRTGNRQALEGDALLSKDVRFYFEPNSSVLVAGNADNEQYFATIKNYLQVSPGSVVMLRGHVDNSLVAKFRAEGEETLRTMTMQAMKLSQDRANAVRQAVLKRHPGIAQDRIEAIGRGWEEPAGSDADKNRRVEVRWFTLE